VDRVASFAEAGDPTGAAAACEQLLTDRLRVLGPAYPCTASSAVCACGRLVGCTEESIMTDSA
jgi:hypothetical protein